MTTIASKAAEGLEPQKVEIVLDKVPRYEQLAPEFLRLHESGASIVTIASAYGMSWQYAAEVLEFARTGKRPQWQSGKRKGGESKAGNRGNRDRYREISAEVAVLRDQQKWSWPRIATEFGVGKSTVRRAYDHAHCGEIRVAAEEGRKPDRGSYSHLGEDVYRRIRELLEAGMRPPQIAEEVGCGRSTVNRERRRMQKASGEDAA